MRKAVLFIAVSMDGFMSGLNGEIDWLDIANNDKFNYEKFDRTVDTTIMGGRTYRQALGFDVPLYPDKTNYIYSKKVDKKAPDNFIFFKGSVPDQLKKLKRKKGKDIFIVGGSAVIHPLIEANAIDEYRIFTLPIMLGKGVPLFPDMKKRVQLSLVGIKKYPSGMVEHHYERITGVK
jgi:dihydrofolate reductase